MKKIAGCLLFLLLTQLTWATDMQRLVQDTQRMEQSEHGFTFVWWIPGEFWNASLKENHQVTDAQRERFVGALEGYTLFVVVVADIGPMGGMVSKKREQIVPNTIFKVGDEMLPLLAEEELSPDAANLILIMKPMLAHMLGQLGNGMEFMFYSNRAHGQRILSATGDKRFSYAVFGKTFSWRLPLGSLLPPKKDPETGEIFPGDYRFSPYSGKALNPVPPAPVGKK